MKVMVIDKLFGVALSLFAVTSERSSVVLLEDAKAEAHVVFVNENIVPRLPCFQEPVPCSPVPCELLETPRLPEVKHSTGLPSTAREENAAHDSSARYDSVKPHVAPKIGCRDCNEKH